MVLSRACRIISSIFSTISCLSIAGAVGAQASVVTNIAAFDSAVNAAGITTATDDFSTYTQGDILNGQTLGSFAYSFDPNLSDLSGTDPTIGVDGAAQVLVGGPNSNGFIGGNSVTLTYQGTGGLLAFGVVFSYSSANEAVPANVYSLGILDGSGATTVGNADPSSPDGLDGNGGSFFLGFVGNPGDVFTQAALFSALSSIDGAGDPFITTTYEINDIIYGAAPLSTVPEPGSVDLLAGGLGMLGLIGLYRRGSRIRYSQVQRDAHRGS